MDYDPPEFFTEKTVQTRKPHRCCECLREISTGETCKYVSGKWEGDVGSFYTCGLCLQVRKELELDYWLLGELVEEVSQCDEWTPIFQEFMDRREENYQRLRQAAGCGPQKQPDSVAQTEAQHKQEQ